MVSWDGRKGQQQDGFPPPCSPAPAPKKCKAGNTQSNLTKSSQGSFLSQGSVKLPAGYFLSGRGQKLIGESQAAFVGGFSCCINQCWSLWAWLIATINLYCFLPLEATRKKWLHFGTNTCLFVLDLSLQNAEVAGALAVTSLFLMMFGLGDFWSKAGLQIHAWGTCGEDAEGGQDVWVPGSRKWCLLGFYILLSPLMLLQCLPSSPQGALVRFHGLQ